jgi:hypothetical protein
VDGRTRRNNAQRLPYSATKPPRSCAITSSSVPPPPEPVWKRWWFWGLVVVVAIIAADAGGGGTTEEANDANATPSASVKPAAESNVRDMPVFGGQSGGQVIALVDDQGVVSGASSPPRAW